MASPALRIRVRCPTVCPAPVDLKGCTPQTRFADFQSMILKALGREREQDLSILTGFPPRPLDMPGDAEIGSKLSDNESVTVRLATQTAGIQQGGKWGRSKRAKTANTTTAATTTATSSSSTRSSSRASRTTAAAAAGAGDATTATGDAGRSSSDPSKGLAGKKKSNGKSKNAGERTAASSGGRNSGSSGGGGGGATARGAASASASSGTSGGGGRAGGVHTLGGPLTRPAASPCRRGSGGGDSGRPDPSPAAAPGQVRTLFGSSAATSRRAAGGSSSSSSCSNGAAAAAAARRVGGAAAASSGSSPSAGGGGGGAEPDAVATAMAAATGGSGAPNRKRPRGTGVQLKSEGDIAERLLTAVGGGGKGTADRFFRKAMKLAVDKQYDQSRADARVRAALGGWYTVEASATQRRLGDGESVALNISFSKGAGAKSQLTETVDRIPREQVSAVVRMIARDPESREMLKPHNFAGCSPRMFWSLVQHWGGDVPAALRLAAPDVDWGFVETRNRKPSEKAVANATAEEAERREAEEERAERARAGRKRKRRKRRKEGIETDSSEEEREEEPQHAAESLPADEVSEEARAASAAAAAADARRRAANAALARLTASQRRPAPAAVGGSAAAAAAAAAAAPVVPDTEEENGDGVEEEEEEEEEEIDMEGLVEVAGEPGAGLLVAAGLRTLGQLADRDEEDLARQLAALQQQQQQQHERDAGEGSAAGEGAAADGGAGGGGGSSGSGEKARVTAEEVSEWVQGARGEELDEIMADIVGGNEDVIEALEEVSVSTPRDLVRMGAFPDVLVGAVRDKVGAERFAPLAGLITTEAVEAWRRKGDRLLEQRPWLELWVHQG
ncbi:unnamed protein product [Ectocarpus sp. CCAP 1310/34]|nr:unnamed protein product [Ectocarpus sp. CCAP 1310/34]